MKKGIFLKYPKTKGFDPSDLEFNEENYEIYTGTPKGDSLEYANKYGFTIDSLCAETPKLSKNN